MRSLKEPYSAAHPAEAGARRLRPTLVRRHIVGLLAIISGLTYLDHLNLSIAGSRAP